MDSLYNPELKFENISEEDPKIVYLGRIDILHKGLDIVNRKGTPVVVTADGRVVFAGYKHGYGKMVIVDHGFEKLTKYGHLSKISVNSGDSVIRGQELGEIGSTGRSTGPHLHYEVVVNGKAVDPVDYLLD